MEKFWEIENGQTEKRQWSEEERMREHLFLKTTKRLHNGRFIVHLPFKENPSTLRESRNLALKRFYYLEKNLQLNEKLREMYTNCLEEYITLGHMTKVTITPDQNVYYIPHHAVLKEDSTTTKLRTVFDASMKASNHKSLNDIGTNGRTSCTILVNSNSAKISNIQVCLHCRYNKNVPTNSSNFRSHSFSANIMEKISL